MKKPKAKKPGKKKPQPKSKPVMVAKRAAPPEISATAVVSGGSAPRRRRSADIKRELSEAYKVVFNSLFGQRVKADIFKRFNVYNQIEGRDLYEIGKREGERNVALHIAQMLGLRPEHFDTDAWDTSGEIDSMMMA